MSIFKRIMPSNMKRWGGWISIDERLEYLLGAIENLEHENELLKDEIRISKQKIHDMPSIVTEELQRKVFVQRISPDLVEWRLKRNETR